MSTRGVTVTEATPKPPRTMRPACRRGLGQLLLPHGGVLAVVLALQPVAGLQLAGSSSFVPAMVALVSSFDLLCAVLLVRQFRDTGDSRALALSWAYVSSLVLLAGWGAAFPGVLGQRPPLGTDPSTAPWLWVGWHTAFPVLIGAALAPWPARWTAPVQASLRRRRVWTTVGGCVVGGLLVMATVIAFAQHLPVLIDGLDTSAMSRVAGPVMLPLVTVGTGLAVVGACRFGGFERWAALAATTSFGDVVLTLFSTYRYSVGWYAGRTLTVVSATVVLVALLAEFSAVKRRLAEEGERLRRLLAHTDGLERLQHTLLNHMVDGVVMHRPSGEVVASNPAAQRLLALTPEQLSGTARRDPRWRLLAADGTPLRSPEPSAGRELSPDTPMRDQIVGVDAPGQPLRWVSVNTSVVREGAERVDCLVSSMTDITERHTAELAAVGQRRRVRDRVETVLTDAAWTVVLQPIVHLSSSRVVGAEALSRFPGYPPRPPDVWFAGATSVGLGTELELAAIRMAMGSLGSLPAGAYLSVNVSPTTVASPALEALLEGVPGQQVVLELTEHASVADYATLDQALRRLRRAGMRLAVDDAGAGFASLRHIVNLRPDIIKLDLALIRGVHADPARRAVTTAMLGFARDIGATVVAEGIETIDEFDTLRALGVEYGQGYLLGRPASPPVPPVVSMIHQPSPAGHLG